MRSPITGITDTIATTINHPSPVLFVGGNTSLQAVTSLIAMDVDTTNSPLYVDAINGGKAKSLQRSDFYYAYAPIILR
jgi:hypothetical protein